MLTIHNHSKDPYFNLALEEYVLKELALDEDFILVWQNDRSIIIGRNQNPFNEANLEFAKNNSIPIIRRMTGGGTVFHDKGNINFSIITGNIQDNLNNYHVFLNPIIEILNSLGVPAQFHGKSDIYIKDKKISGNAQTYYKNKMVHHGTLLFDSDQAILSTALKASQSYDSKSIDSNLSTTTNIRKHLAHDMDIETFKAYLITELLDGSLEGKVYTLTQADYDQINHIIETKYKTWDWTYGQSPEFIVKKEYDNRMLLTMIVRDGIIKDISIDCFENVIQLEKCLLGTKFDEEHIRKSMINTTNYDIDKFIKALFY